MHKNLHVEEELENLENAALLPIFWKIKEAFNDNKKIINQIIFLSSSVSDLSRTINIVSTMIPKILSRLLPKSHVDLESAKASKKFEETPYSWVDTL